MNLASLDLNLLVALDALLAEASVGRAAARLGLSQPATSHALRRLRLIMRDPLLVRVGARMELTRRAEAVRESLAEALIGVRRLFVTGGFEPGTSSRQFSLIMADYVANLIMPPLIERISAEAPGIRIELLPWQGPAAMTAELARTIHLVTACTGEAFKGFHRQRLFADGDARAVTRGHPTGRRWGRPPAV